MAETISKAALIISANSAEFTAGLNKSQADTETFLGKLTSLFQSKGGFIQSFVGKGITQMFGGSALTTAVQLGGKVTAIAEAASALVGKIREVASEISHASKQASRLGVSFATFQALEFAGKSAGVEDMGGALDKLNKHIGQALDGNTQLREAFEKLGVSTTDLRSKSLDEVLAKMGEGFQEVTSTAERAALAEQLAGRGQAAFVEFLSRGSAAMEDSKRNARELGVALSDVEAQDVSKMNRPFAQLSLGMKGLWMQITSTFAPLLEGIGNFFVSVRKFIEPVIEAVKEIIKPIGEFIGTAFTAIGKVLSIFTPILSAIGKAISFLMNGVKAVAGFIVDVFNKITFGIFDKPVEVKVKPVKENVQLKVAGGNIDRLSEVFHENEDAIKKAQKEVDSIDWETALAKMPDAAKAHLPELKRLEKEYADAVKEFTKGGVVGHSIRELFPVTTGFFGSSNNDEVRKRMEAADKAYAATADKAWMAFKLMKELEAQVKALRKVQAEKEAVQFNLDLTNGIEEAAIKTDFLRRGMIATAEQIKIAKLEARGISDTLLNRAKDREREFDVANRILKVEEMTLALNRESDSIHAGLNDKEAELNRLQLQGVDIAKAKDALRRNDLEKRFGGEFNQTPLDKFKKSFADIREAFKKGIVNVNGFGKATEEALSSAEQALNIGKLEAPSLMLAGGREAAETIVRAQVQGVGQTQEDRIKTVLERGVEYQRRQTEIAEQLLEAVQNNQLF